MPDHNFETLFTPASLQSINFRIPLYQRPYAWEAPQINSLLVDLHSAYRGGHTFYHIGILSIAMTDDGRFDLIDGQQRMTTLMLIGKVAQKYFSEWSRFLTTDRLDLYGREHDKAFLDGDEKHIHASKCNRRMVAAVQRAEEYFLEECGTKEQMEGFAKYIYDNVAFFLSLVPPDYRILDKNQHFVRMNNRGKQLEKHEILKVQLIDRIPKVEQLRGFEIWNSMANCLTGKKGNIDFETVSLRTILKNESVEKEEGSERLNSAIVTIPEFLLIALSRYRKKPENAKLKVLSLVSESSDPDKLIEIFQPLYDDPLAIGGFISLLNDQLELFRSFFIFSDLKGEYNLPIRDKDDERKPEFAFDDAVEEKARLIAVQSFLNVSTEPHHWLIPALDWLQSWKKEHGDKKMPPDLFVKSLESIDNSLIPSNCIGLAGNDGKRKLSPITDIGGMTYGSISWYWFYRLDYELLKLWDTKDSSSSESIWRDLYTNKEKNVKDLVDKFRFRRCGSVEHINPQNPIEMKTKADVNAFGNLALISANRNSKFSNYSPQAKKEMIISSTDPYTESLKMVHFLWCTSDEDIVDAGYNLLKILFNAVRDGIGDLVPELAEVMEGRGQDS